MSNWNKATWKKGKEIINGQWIYHWAADRFTVCLDKRDPLTGQPRKFVVAGDSPKFNGFKLIREKKQPTKKGGL